MSASGKRTAWPDWVKGIGILSIVMAHVTQYFPGGASCLNRILCSYHVPVFFVWGGVSAALWPGQYEVERRDFYLKRVKRFLIPYVLFSLFNSALKLMQYFGKESLLVMLIHPTVLLFFTYPFGRSFATMTGLRSFACAMLTFAAVAALNVPVIYCINRWFPILKGEVKKR